MKGKPPSFFMTPTIIVVLLMAGEVRLMTLVRLTA
jgi:hypothetical protein